MSEVEVLEVEDEGVWFDRVEGRWRRSCWLPLDRWRRGMGAAEVLLCG